MALTPTPPAPSPVLPNLVPSSPPSVLPPPCPCPTSTSSEDAGSLRLCLAGPLPRDVPCNQRPAVQTPKLLACSPVEVLEALLVVVCSAHLAGISVLELDPEEAQHELVGLHQPLPDLRRLLKCLEKPPRVAESEATGEARAGRGFRSRRSGCAFQSEALACQDGRFRPISEGG